MKQVLPKLPLKDIIYQYQEFRGGVMIYFGFQMSIKASVLKAWLSADGLFGNWSDHRRWGLDKGTESWGMTLKIMYCP